MLIRDAEVWQRGRADVRIEGGLVAAIGDLSPRGWETVLDARGGALLPGLHDHHIHLPALAAKRASIACGPPHVVDEEGLARALDRPGTGWLRGIGFHESVTSGHLPDAAHLDSLVPERPVRLQHRTGRMWLLNTPALAALLERAAPPPGLERADGRYTGRLFDEDGWLQQALAGSFPSLAETSADLAAFGVTGITDMTPRNDAVAAGHFAAQHRDGAVRQRLVLAGTLGLASAAAEGWTLGPAKLHLHEAALPDFDQSVDFIRAAHRQGRGVAVHCVTQVELVFALAAFEAAGASDSDRIEHVSVASRELVAAMRALGLHACVQPHFVAERGDRYLADVEPDQVPDLYRLRTLRDAGIPLAGGSDAPYGSADPWAAMAAAVSRATPSGAVLDPAEALTPEEALALFLADPLDLRRTRQVGIGEPADLCLLAQPWMTVRERLADTTVRATVVGGRLVHQCVDEPPFEGPGRTDASA